jgi:hypothetical protein
LQVLAGSHDNRLMETNDSVLPVQEFPTARAMRRFWIAWLVFLLAMLAVIFVTILIAAMAADPPHISPSG